MNSFETFLRDELRKTPPSLRDASKHILKVGYIAGLRRAAEIANARANRATVIDYGAGIRHTMQDIESEASLIEGSIGEKT
jgi:hypothetical protein